MCLTIPGRIVEVDASDPLARTARVDFGGTTRTASLLYLPEAHVGNYVLVQAGFATAVVPEAEALEALAYHAELSQTFRETVEVARSDDPVEQPGG